MNGKQVTHKVNLPSDLWTEASALVSADEARSQLLRLGLLFLLQYPPAACTSWLVSFCPSYSPLLLPWAVSDLELWLVKFGLLACNCLCSGLQGISVWNSTSHNGTPPPRLPPSELYRVIKRDSFLFLKYQRTLFPQLPARFESSTGCGLSGE